MYSLKKYVKCLTTVQNCYFSYSIHGEVKIPVKVSKQKTSYALHESYNKNLVLKM